MLFFLHPFEGRLYLKWVQLGCDDQLGSWAIVLQDMEY